MKYGETFPSATRHLTPERKSETFVGKPFVGGVFNSIFVCLKNMLARHSPSPEVIKLFSCSTQLSMKFILLINLKILTIF